MVTRTDGPFQYYGEIHPGVNGDTIRADAADPGLHASTIAALSDELEGDARRVPTQVSGAITSAVRANPETASGHARELAGKGTYAVGLMCGFAGMVDVFDTTVNGLNVRYRSDLASAMRWAGQAAASTADKLDDDQVTEAHMGPGIKANLQPKYDAAVTALDNGADIIASMFNGGAKVDNVRALMRFGLIPLTAAPLYDGLTVSKTDRWYYFQAIGQPDPEGTEPADEGEQEGEHWWETAAKWTYNHTVVPTVNTLANIGQAALEHPEDIVSMAAGVGLMALGGVGEGGGVLLDATGVGAVLGVPINVASAAVIATGATLTTAGTADLLHNASQNHNTVLNEAQGPSGSTPGEPLPSSSRPSTAGSHWEGRVAESGKGEVWQDPAKMNAPKGQPKDANELRVMDPTSRYPDGYVVFYNDGGQPIGLDGKSGDRAHTHIPREPDGSYPTPQGWNP